MQPSVSILLWYQCWVIKRAHEESVLLSLHVDERRTGFMPLLSLSPSHISLCFHAPRATVTADAHRRWLSGSFFPSYIVPPFSHPEWLSEKRYSDQWEFTVFPTAGNHCTKYKCTHRVQMSSWFFVPDHIALLCDKKTDHYTVRRSQGFNFFISLPYVPLIFSFSLCTGLCFEALPVCLHSFAESLTILNHLYAQEGSQWILPSSVFGVESHAQSKVWH